MVTVGGHSSKDFKGAHSIPLGDMGTCGSYLKVFHESLSYWPPSKNPHRPHRHRC